MKIRMFARGLAFSIAALFGVNTAEIGFAQEAAPTSSSDTGMSESRSAVPSEAGPRVGLGPDQWGLQQSVVTIASGSFVPYDHLMSYETFDQKRTRLAPGGSGFFDANVDLPSGAKIFFIELEACDTDPAQEIAAFLAECPGPAGTCSAFPAGLITTSGTPGCNYFGAAVDGPVVDRFNNMYVVRVRIDGTSGMTSFRAVRVFYRLQVSPAPAVATFPNDVPTSHPFFRFIEALAASGVTAGCGPGSYCPDNPISRGEMAVFLAAALGLYWTN